MSTVSIFLSDDLQALVDAYRYGIKAKTGRLPTRATGITELLKSACKTIPEAPEAAVSYAELIASVKDLKGRVEQLERQ